MAPLIETGPNLTAGAEIEVPRLKANGLEIIDLTKGEYRQ